MRIDICSIDYRRYPFDDEDELYDLKIRFKLNKKILSEMVIETEMELTPRQIKEEILKILGGNVNDNENEI